MFIGTETGASSTYLLFSSHDFSNQCSSLFANHQMQNSSSQGLIAMVKVAATPASLDFREQLIMISVVPPVYIYIQSGRAWWHSWNSQQANNAMSTPLSSELNSLLSPHAWGTHNIEQDMEIKYRTTEVWCFLHSTDRPAPFFLGRDLKRTAGAIWCGVGKKIDIGC